MFCIVMVYLLFVYVVLLQSLPASLVSFVLFLLRIGSMYFMLIGDTTAESNLRNGDY